MTRTCRRSSLVGKWSPVSAVGGDARAALKAQAQRNATAAVLMRACIGVLILDWVIHHLRMPLGCPCSRGARADGLLGWLAEAIDELVGGAVDGLVEHRCRMWVASVVQ